MVFGVMVIEHSGECLRKNYPREKLIIGTKRKTDYWNYLFTVTVCNFTALLIISSRCNVTEYSKKMKNEIKNKVKYNKIKTE